MKRRKSPLRRVALGSLGMLPLVGALISIFWMLLVHARPGTWGAAIGAYTPGERWQPVTPPPPNLAH